MSLINTSRFSRQWKLSLFMLGFSLVFSGNTVMSGDDALKNDNLQGQALREAMQANPAIAKPLAADNGVEWCQTELVYRERYGSLNRGSSACPTEGDCDIATNRDSKTPNPADPPMIIRLKFNVFANDDGSQVAATQEEVDAQVVQLNIDFAPSRIQFEYQTEVFNNSTYRVFNSIEGAAMKHAYAELPAEQLNIYVVAINEGYIGVGTFPWDPQALTNTGGIIMDDGFFGAGHKTLTHEVGHCLGLWHTHHGVSEVAPCSGCWEYANGANDVTGDFCADTEPTPTNFTCSPPPGSDECNGQSWGATDPQNYMSYAPDGCYSEFSVNQWGRMHCWSGAELFGWQSGVNFDADTVFGQAPLDVQFTATTQKIVNGWSWDFGDGDIASIQSPFHTFSIPGVRDILVTVDATDGTFSKIRRLYVATYADTLLGANSDGAPGASVKVPVYANNFLPLFQLSIPFGWSGPMNLSFDSASTKGLRTEYLDVQGLSSVDPFNDRGTYIMSANVLGGTAPLAPDTGVVLNLFFSIPASVSVSSNPIVFENYGSNTLKFIYSDYVYVPVVSPGQVTVCVKAGDPNGSGDITIADVTFLIARIFTGGPEPTPPNSGDASCDGSISIADVTFLIAHIFTAGPAPCDCAP